MATLINADTSDGLKLTSDTSGEIQLQSAGTTAVTIDTSQRAAFVAGTAALPAITTTGDTNTGMFFPAADTIAFAEGGTEAMRINSSGNVGIGTSSPNGLAELRRDAAAPYLVLNRDNDKQWGASISSTGNLAFQYGTTYASMAISTPAMAINSSGNVLVGCTTAPSASVAGVSLSSPTSAAPRISVGANTGLYTALGFTNGNGNVGAINTTGSSTQYATSSDYRLKENIVPMTGALARVSLLKPVTYSWKSDGITGEGFIAHELQEVIPDCVSGEKDAVDAEGNPKYQGVDTSFLVATLTAAIQEQQAIIETLTTRVEALEAK
jgi:hypothetical protein